MPANGERDRRVAPLMSILPSTADATCRAARDNGKTPDLRATACRVSSAAGVTRMLLRRLASPQKAHADGSARTNQLTNLAPLLF
jgi:hypothetical protein